MTSKAEFPVSFTIEHAIGCVRIKSVAPAGIFISTDEEQAAYKLFERAALELAGEKIDAEVFSVDDIDWSSGKLVVTAHEPSSKTKTEFQEGETHEEAPIDHDHVLDVLCNPSGRLMVVGYRKTDQSEVIDAAWLIEQAQKYTRAISYN